MKHEFYKYHGTGNDFILIDNRQQVFDKNNTKLIAELCDRRFGIGADGLILLEPHKTCDFLMVYFNADGNESTMCGNGGRCISHFARHLGLIEEHCRFEAIDGQHEAIIAEDQIKLKMQNVIDIRLYLDYVVLDTGSPHFVKVTTNLNSLNVDIEGAEIRYSEPFDKKGINVNFVEKSGNDKFSVRTYERGVEAETLSCGTGVTAVALGMHYIGETEKNLIAIQTPGGNLEVIFERKGHGYENIWLIGPAIQVFKGEMVW